MTNLDDITSELGLRHATKQIATTDLEESRGEFFEAITAKLEGTVLATQTIQVPEGRDPGEWVQERYPGWRVVRNYAIKGATVLIEEDPAIMRFSWVNQDDGYVYARTTSQATPWLDDEALRAEEPEVWARNSEPDPEALRWIEYFAESDDEISRRQRLAPRVLISQEFWLPKDLDVLQRYIIPGKITVKLAAPRRAKPEELEG